MIAKGNVYISHDELIRLLNLPSDVEILEAERVDGVDVGFEFKIASKNPIGNLTVETHTWQNVRRQRVPRATLTASQGKDRVPNLKGRGTIGVNERRKDN